MRNVLEATFTHALIFIFYLKSTLFQVAGKLNLSTATVHLALRIIDLFMDGHDIQAWNHNDLDST